MKLIFFLIMLVLLNSNGKPSACENFAAVLEDEEIDSETLSIAPDCRELVCEITNCCGRVQRLTMRFDIHQLPNQYNRRCYPNYESTYVKQIQDTWGVNDAQAKIKNLIGIYSQFNSYCRYIGNKINGSVQNKLNIFNNDLNWKRLRTKQTKKILDLLPTTSLKNSFLDFDKKIFDEWMNNLNPCLCENFKNMKHFSFATFETVVNGIRYIPRVCPCLPNPASSMTSAFFYSTKNTKWVRAYPSSNTILINPSNTANIECEFEATRNNDGTYYFKNFNKYMTRRNNILALTNSSPSNNEKFRLKTTSVKDQYIITTADGKNYLFASSNDFRFTTSSGSATFFKVLFYYPLKSEKKE